MPAPISISCLFAAGLMAAAVIPAVSGTAHAADANLKAALYDLDRVAKQLPGLTPKRKANIARLLRNLEGAEGRLAASGDKDSQDWKDADARLKTYRQQLKDLMAGTSAPAKAQAPAAAATTPQAAKPSGAAPAIKMTSSDVSRFNRLVRTYQTIAGNLQRLDPKALHGNRERTKWRGQITRLGNDIAAFKVFIADPNVAQLTKNVADMTAAYKQIEANSLAAYESLGDVPGQLTALLQRYQRDKLPVPLDAPYEADRMAAWAKYLKAFVEQTNTDAAWLTKVAATTDLHGFDINNALNGTVGHTAKTALETAVKKTREEIYKPLQKLQYGPVKMVSELSPDDTHKIRNTLLGEGKYEALMADIRAALQAIETGTALDIALGQKKDPATDQLTAEISARRDKINALFETVLADVRMPAAKSDDTELTAAAEKVLSGERYGYKWDRLVINSGLNSKRETRAWWSGNTAKAATYAWKEFQVATAEKVGDQYFIFYNLFHYYSSGDSTTPLNRWILNKRFQSSRILEDNIAK